MSTKIKNVLLKKGTPLKYGSVIVYLNKDAEVLVNTEDINTLIINKKQKEILLNMNGKE